MTTERIIVELMFHHAWILFIFVTCLNAVIFWRRSQQYIRENPSLAPGYRSLIRGWLLFGNLPWLVMGMGILFGGVPTIFHYFNPRNGPMVVTWYVVVVGLWIVSFYWLFLADGVETLIAHPGLIRMGSDPHPWFVKAYLLMCLAGGVIGLLTMILWDVPSPPDSFYKAG